MSSETFRYADVALALPGLGPLTYGLPEDLAGRAAPGLRAEVPVGRRMMMGVITSLRRSSHRLCKPVASIPDDNPVLDGHLLWLTRWVAHRYLCGWGQAVWSALPPGMNRRQRSLVVPSDGAVMEAATEAEAAVLKLLLERGRASPSWLAGRVGPEALAALAAMEERGLIQMVSEWRGGRARPRTERWLVAAGSESPSKLTPARDKLWQRLRECGAIKSPDARPASAAEWMVSCGLARWETREAPAVSVNPDMEPEPEVKFLSRDQQEAFDGIAAGLERGRFGASLLFGVTASGKTEVYIRAARNALERGRQVLVLVPEIGLVSQMASRLSGRFPGLGVWHSELSDGERYDVWRAARDGRCPLVVGVRSAVFAPLGRLGLLVVDEEHDSSYKQQDTEPHYHAREVAVARAGRLGVQVILGSATPSAESFFKSRTGAYRIYSLGRRDGQAAPPMVELVDCRPEKNHEATLSARLGEELRERIAAGGQAMLLLNRRGFARAVQCRRCGDHLRCRNCDISLTYHREGGQVLCHYCGFRRRLPEHCPSCGSPGLEERGGGIQRLEQEVSRLLPGVGMLRMDSDTTGRKGSHGRILSSFQRGEARVLIGTQMISKGHHFPGVSLVGIVNIDDILGLPDFRSAERAAQLLVQMSGRAGRERLPGTVLVQTRLPGAPALGALGPAGYLGLLEAELAQRMSARYPPYVFMALITVSAVSSEGASETAAGIVRSLAHSHPGVEVLGPAPAPIPRIRGRHRWQVLLKSRQLAALLAAGRSVSRGSRGTSVRVDVDPSSTL